MYKFNLIPIFGAALIATCVAGCQSLPPSGAASNPDSTPSAIAQGADKGSDLNLTDAQKAQMKQIREQTQTKIVALLSADQQKQFKAATADGHEPAMKALHDLNLSADQKKQVSEIIRTQRQQTQAILTPEQQAKFKQNHPSRGQS